MSTINDRLLNLGIEIPQVNPPQGNYLSYVRTGSLVFVAGQGPRQNGQLLYKGTVGRDLSVEDGQAAARLCALNVLGQLKHACEGDSAELSEWFVSVVLSGALMILRNRLAY